MGAWEEEHDPGHRGPKEKGVTEVTLDPLCAKRPFIFPSALPRRKGKGSWPERCRSSPALAQTGCVILSKSLFLSGPVCYPACRAELTLSVPGGQKTSNRQTKTDQRPVPTEVRTRGPGTRRHRINDYKGGYTCLLSPYPGHAATTGHLMSPYAVIP